MKDRISTITTLIVVFTGLASTGCTVQAPPELTDALGSGDLDTIQSILEENPRLIKSHYEPDGDTLLHQAVQSGDRELAELLVAGGADVGAKNKRGSTPLDMIVGTPALHTENHREIAEFLISNGVDIRNRKGFLHRVLVIGWHDLAKHAIDQGIDVNAKDRDGNTPLHLANNVKDNIEFTELLIAKGADVNAKSKSGMTPLHQAVRTRNGRKDVVELLIANGAEVDVKDKSGLTPLYWAVAHKRTDSDVIEYLIDRGGDVNTRTQVEGYTPLRNAVINQRKDIVELLIGNGADINAKDRTFGETALHKAALFKHKDIVELLVANGADVNAKNKNGRPPLYWAVKKGHKDIAELLRKHGALE
jgi:cytohesin